MKQSRLVPPIGWRYPNEQSWLVGETLGAIASLAHFARTGKAADAQAIDFQVQDERPLGTDKIAFQVRQRGGEGGPFQLVVTEHVFSPKAFAVPAAKWLGDLKASAPRPSRELPDRLVDLRLERLHAAHIEVSEALTRDPLSVQAHEDAAFVVTAFALREAAAGHTDPRRLLIRITAHQALAAALRGQAPPSPAGRLADVGILVLAGRTGEAAERTLQAATSPGERAWTRALHLFATQDWREMSWRSRLSLVERLAWFKAFQARNGSDRAYPLLAELPAEQRELPDWGRIRLTGFPTVRDCHEFAVGGYIADIGEATAASTLFRGKPLDPMSLAEALNDEAALSPVVSSNGAVRVEVLDWGTVAAFIQRHIGARLSYEAGCYERTFGMPQETASVVEAQEKIFGGLTLFPPEALRWVKTAGPYERYAKAATRLVMERPELLTAHVWARLLEAPHFAQAPDVPADSIWFDPPLPFGTHFADESLYGPLYRRHPPNAVYEEIIRLDPYDTGVRWAYAKQRFGEEPKYERLLEAYGPALEWDLASMQNIARHAKSNAGERRRWLTAVCKLEADYCNGLARFLLDSGDEDGAAEAYRRWWREGLDRVAVANDVDWLVKYDQKNGRNAEAWKVARDAASTYSGRGLATLAALAEDTGRLEEAEENFRKEAERYDRADVLYEFYVRQIAKGNKRFEAARDALFKAVFPQGFETLTSTPTDKPRDGAALTFVEPKAVAAGFRKDDILVALDGVRIHSRPQWEILRMRGRDPDMRVLVHRGGAYLEVRCRFADRQVPARFSSYPPER